MKSQHSLLHGTQRQHEEDHVNIPHYTWIYGLAGQCCLRRGPQLTPGTTTPSLDLDFELGLDDFKLGLDITGVARGVWPLCR